MPKNFELRILKSIILTTRFTDFFGLGQKASNVARALKNLEKFKLDVYDENEGKFVGVPIWIYFVHSIPSLKSLQVYLHEDIWKEWHARLFSKDSLPHLERLTLSSLKGCLDFKMLLSVSKKISDLELVSHLYSKDDECSCLNLEQTDLRGLKMLSFNHPMFDMVQWTHIMTELEARYEFGVLYEHNWDVEMAERLGKWLRLPNFKWDWMTARWAEEKLIELSNFASYNIIKYHII